MITPTAAVRALGRMSLTKFFPGDEFARAGLMEFLGEACESDEQVLWLGRYVSRLPEWPGINGLQNALLVKFPSLASRVPREDVIHPDIGRVRIAPPLSPADRAKLASAPKERPKLLLGAAGSDTQISVDPEAEKMVLGLATARAMPAPKQFRVVSDDEERVNTELRAILHEPIRAP